MDLDRARARLEEERERLQRSRARLIEEQASEELGGSGELSGYDQHLADLGTETFEREKNVALLESIEAELEEIAGAFRRLEDGRYGYSTLSGERIEDERLDAVPWARLTVQEQARSEREAGLGGRAT
jgi:DnaK suppressor protein